jgi:hypothetical protein
MATAHTPDVTYVPVCSICWEAVEQDDDGGWAHLQPTDPSCTCEINGASTEETRAACVVHNPPPAAPEPAAEEEESADTGRVIPSRSTDPETSHRAAAAIEVKAGTHRAKLLQAFSQIAVYGRYDGTATDEEAASLADLLHAEYAKRCSELREAGMIEQLPGVVRKGRAGVDRLVCQITPKGVAVVKAL